MKYEVKNGVGIIPQGTKKVVAEAFKGCKELTAIEIPEGVISIGNSAFQGCTSLTDVKLPSTLEYIEEDAFLDCKSLNELVFPKSLKGISVFAFSGAKINYIEIKSEDPRLVNFYAQQSDITSTSDFFYISAYDTKRIIVPAGSLQNYIDALKQSSEENDWRSKVVDTNGHSAEIWMKEQLEAQRKEKEKREEEEEKKNTKQFLLYIVGMLILMLICYLCQ